MFDESIRKFKNLRPQKNSDNKLSYNGQHLLIS